MSTHELVVPTSDGDDHGAGSEVADVGSLRLDAGEVRASRDHSPLPAPTPPAGHSTTCPVPCCGPVDLPPFTVDEYDALITTIWSNLEDDPQRFGNLMTRALAFIGQVAIGPVLGAFTKTRATEVLREMEQRSLWGAPTNPKDDL